MSHESKLCDKQQARKQTPDVSVQPTTTYKVRVKIKIISQLTIIMGSLFGHIVPGTFFGLSGVWWCYNVFFNYYRSKLRNGPIFFNRSWFPFRAGKFIPLESVTKVVLAITGMTGELITELTEHRAFKTIDIAQHMTMYFFFGMNGAVELLMYYGVHLPYGLESVTLMLAFIVEGLLFYNHLHGRTLMDVQLHMFLVLVIVACALSILMEMVYRNSIMPSLCRAYFTITQATWFYQTGFVLYPPPGMNKWDQEDHRQMMMITLSFTWHLAVNLIAVLGLGILIRMRVKMGGGQFLPTSDVEYQRLDHRSTSPKPFSNGGNTNVNNN